MAKITNKYGLPQALVNYAEKGQHTKRADAFSVTTLLKGNREIILEKRHCNDITIDVSECVWALFGTAVHSILETADTSGNAEQYLSEHIRGGYYLTGKADLYNEADMALEDWKTCSVSKVLKGDFTDWKMQGLMYVWLFRKRGIYLNKIKFHAFIKDWNSFKAKMDNEYPQTAIYTYYCDVSSSDMRYIEEWIYNKFDELLALIDTPDAELPMCSASERWYTGDTYAVYKTGGKRALKVCNTVDEALGYMKNKGGDFFEIRKGNYLKCENYCKYCKGE